MYFVLLPPLLGGGILTNITGIMQPEKPAPPKNQDVQVTIRKQIKMLNPLQTICFMFRNSIYSKGVTWFQWEVCKQGVENLGS